MCGVVLLLHQLRLPPALLILAGASDSNAIQYVIAVRLNYDLNTNVGGAGDQLTHLRGGFAFFGIYVLLGGKEVLTALKLMRRGLRLARESTAFKIMKVVGKEAGGINCLGNFTLGHISKLTILVWLFGQFVPSTHPARPAALR